jgi:hypothetical protein
VHADHQRHVLEPHHKTDTINQLQSPEILSACWSRKLVRTSQRSALDQPTFLQPSLCKWLGYGCPHLLFYEPEAESVQCRLEPVERLHRRAVRSVAPAQPHLL